MEFFIRQQQISSTVKNIQHLPKSFLQTKSQCYLICINATYQSVSIKLNTNTEIWRLEFRFWLSKYLSRSGILFSFLFFFFFFFFLLMNKNGNERNTNVAFQLFTVLWEHTHFPKIDKHRITNQLPHRAARLTLPQFF